MLCGTRTDSNAFEGPVNPKYGVSNLILRRIARVFVPGETS